MVDLGNFRFDLKRAGDDVRRRLETAGAALVTGLRSAGNLAAGLGIAAFGGLVGFGGLQGVREPDSVLLERAKESAQAAAAAVATRSAVSERDVYLWMLGVGTAVLLGGIWSLYGWWRDPLGKRKGRTAA
jgi:hypothetical protein